MNKSATLVVLMVSLFWLIGCGAEAPTGQENSKKNKEVSSTNSREKSDSKTNENGDTTGLFQLIRDGNKKKLKSRIQQEAKKIIDAGVHGRTPLTQAIYLGNKDIVRILLNHGAEPNKPDNHGYTPLHMAARWGQYSICKELLQRKVNVNSKLPNGQTPIVTAAVWANSEDHVKIIKTLSKRGAEIPSLETLNIPVAPGVSVYWAAKHGHPEVISVLREANAQKLNQTMNKPGYSKTPLQLAIEEGHSELAKVLIAESHSQNNLIQESNDELLRFASKHGRAELVEYMIELGWELNVTSSSKVSALNQAIENGHSRVVRILVNNGAQIHEKDVRELIAFGYNHPEILEIIRDHYSVDDVNLNPVFWHAIFGTPASLRQALNKVGNVNVTDPTYQHTPLHWATSANRLDNMRVLIEKGARLDPVGRYNQSPLEIASMRGFENAVKLLIEKGANKNGSGDFTRALQSAVSANQIKIVKILLAHDANLHDQTQKRPQPIHYAAWKADTMIADFLLDRGAPINAIDDRGFSPLHYAVKENRESMTRFLLKNGADPNQVVEKGIRAGKTPIDLTDDLAVKKALVKYQMR